MAKITKDNTKEINTLTTDIKVIMNDVSYIKSDIKEVKETLNCNETKFVGKVEFTLVNGEQNKRLDKMESLVNRIIWGIAIFVLSTVGKGLLDLVINVRASN
jgi:hypothetical protein